MHPIILRERRATLRCFMKAGELKKYGRRYAIKRAKWRRKHQKFVRLSVRMWPAIEKIWEIFDAMEDAAVLVEEQKNDIIDPERLLRAAR